MGLVILMMLTVSSIGSIILGQSSAVHLGLLPDCILHILINMDDLVLLPSWAVRLVGV